MDECVVGMDLVVDGSLYGGVWEGDCESAGVGERECEGGYADVRNEERGLLRELIDGFLDAPAEGGGEALVLLWQALQELLLFCGHEASGEP